MQEHIAKNLRISILIWLLLLALAFPYLLAYYERQQEFQWQEMVQPHWEVVNVPVATAAQDVVDENAVKENTVEPVVLETSALEPVAEQKLEMPASEKPSVPIESNKKKVIPKAVIKKKNSKLALRLPDNLYQGEVSEWDEKKPVLMPDLFAPKRESERMQLGGRLLMDEGTKKKQKAEDASYLDSLQGAEVNISIKVP